MTQNNPQLVPSVVVDRNGKTTTVYKKPNKPVRSSAFTSPVLPAAKPTGKMTGEEIAYTIIRRLKNYTPPNGYPKVRIFPEVRHSLLEGATDRDHIRGVHTLFETLMSGTEPQHYQAIHTLIKEMDLASRLDMKVLYSQMDYVMKNPTSVMEIAHFGRFLVREGIIDPDSEAPFASLSAHVEAQRHYRRLHAAQHGYYSDDPFNDYRKLPNYMAAVERYYDKLEYLFSYKELRSVEGDTFDEQDFQNYLQQGAVANGWL
jgi:hypothetical protein